MILIVSHKTDYTVDFVVEKLNRRKINYYRFNTDDFPNNKELTIHLEERRLDVNWGLTEAVTAIWFRRLKYPDLSMFDPATVGYVASELDGFYSNLWELLSCKWMSVPRDIYRAENKLHQLRIASELGFKIPPTIVSSSAGEIQEFYKRHSRNAIIKPVSSGRFFDGKHNNLIYTSKLNDTAVNSLPEKYPLPSIVQQYVEKKIEIRITIVGDKAFVASVDSQSDPDTVIDWRRKKMKFSEHRLPKDVISKCISLVKRLNLSFGAIDMIENKDGEFVFLEINPNGQWAWIEMDTNLPISDAIINFLTNE